MDESEIRADERAKVEAELRSLSDPDTRHNGRRQGQVDTGEVPTSLVDENAVRADERAQMERDRDRNRDYDADNDRLDPMEVVRTRSFSFGQLLTMIVGAALVVLGVFALIETGVDTPLDQPVEDVLGYAHTPLLGIVEIGVGVLLVLLGLRPGGRWFAAVLGLGLVLAGLLVLVELDWAVENLGAETAYAWIPMAAGFAVIAAALLTPRRHQRMTGVPSVAPTT